MRNCKTCKKEIHRGYHGHILKYFCSNKCKFEAKKTGLSMVDKVCENCHKDFKVQKSQGKGRFCSLDCVFKFQKGENGANWRGGVTTENEKIRKSIPYKKWRWEIFVRDNFECQICGQKGGDLRANHIKKFADYPDLRLEPTNGVTICRNCDNRWVWNHEPDWESYFNFNLMARGLRDD